MQRLSAHRQPSSPQIISNSFFNYENKSPYLPQDTEQTFCLIRRHRCLWHLALEIPNPTFPNLNNWQATVHEDDKIPLLTVSGWRWAEDSFQSSPNSVTKTQFRNKILRDTFPFPPLAADLRRQRDASPHHIIYLVLPGVLGGDWPRGGHGVGAGRQTLTSYWAPKTLHKIHGPKSPARDSRVLPKPRPLISDSSHLTYHLQTFLQDDPSTQVHVTV